MNNNELKEQIKEMNSYHIEELISLFHETLTIILNSTLKYGINNPITKKCFEAIKEYLKIIKAENQIKKVLLKNQKHINIESALTLLSHINELEKKTYFYFEEIMEDCEIACELNEFHRLKSPNKDFLLLTETDNYQKETIRILLGEKIVEKYLCYPQEFWNFISSKTTIVEEDAEENKDFYGVFYKLNPQNNVNDIKVIIPKIKNLQTLLINIHEYQHAFVLYKCFHKKFLNLDYEKMAIEEEQKFLEQKLLPTYQKYFKN